MKQATKIIFKIILSLLFILFFIWVALAFYYQAPFGKDVGYIFLVLWLLFSLWILKTQWGKRPWRGRLAFLLSFLCVLGWWHTIKPSNDRLWYPTLTHGVTADFDSQTVHIHNIRNFDWSDPTHTYTSWIDGEYDMDSVVGVDLYLSYWMGPYLAHSLVGFNFADGRQIIFSSELRIEQDEEYSNIAGFFKKYELIMLAGTAEDIIYQRANSPYESVFRYSLKVSKEDAKNLFIIYLTAANDLAHNARFYNTFSSNCTTVIFELAKKHFPDLPSDYRVILSGLLPYYLYEHGFIDTTLPLHDTMANAYISTAQPVPPDLVAAKQ
ncbi:DUF4105 domain-containing protein [Bartonella sp. HY329]|uniref:Lnb N-terminal periplasmic domain-containing protein n=1 Tax=unclassified Bartonella TaxID=2645622 RepID=UPI0021C9257C|nr:MULTISPECIES: DUF4105 domain-containing protein [unclassified Bartonella]UXM94569.1 DUF4105 domain-containing protein [Bartonella sp. HY329]UXN08893.1 DUF4105 domain-containing protein [Bartonella sp. HY328]